MMVDRNLTQDDVHSFLLNAYFGEVADPFFTAADSAYLDLNRTIEFNKTDVSVDLKAALRARSVKLIKDSVKELSENSIITQESFDTWHIELCSGIKQNYIGAGVPFHYGQAQKWVNMTMKYLSVINSGMTKSFFECLHIPIDSIVLDIAFEEFSIERPIHRWSRMEQKEYLDYQSRLRSAILSSKGLAPLLWEFRNWNR